VPIKESYCPSNNVDIYLRSTLILFTFTSINHEVKKMKFTVVGLLGLAAQFVSAVPTPTLDDVEGPLQERGIAKRATITDVPTVGYASTNGGLVSLSLF
jgi:hypothetical protein